MNFITGPLMRSLNPLHPTEHASSRLPRLPEAQQHVMHDDIMTKNRLESYINPMSLPLPEQPVPVRAFTEASYFCITHSKESGLLEMLERHETFTNSGLCIAVCALISALQCVVSKQYFDGLQHSVFFASFSNHLKGFIKIWNVYLNSFSFHRHLVFKSPANIGYVFQVTLYIKSL